MMKKAISLILCLTMAITLSSCAASNTPQPSSSSTKQSPVSSPTEASSPSAGLDFNADKKPVVPIPSSVFMMERETITLDKKNMYSVNDTIAYDDVSFSNFKFTETYTLPKEIKKENFHYFFKADENGVLYEGRSYMFVDCDVTNLTDQKLVYCLYTARFVELNENLDITDVFCEPSYITELRPNIKEEDKDQFFTNLEPNETISVTIGYILENERIDPDAFYYIAPTQLDSNAKAMKIEKGSK